MAIKSLAFRPTIVLLYKQTREIIEKNLNLYSWFFAVLLVEYAVTQLLINQPDLLPDFLSTAIEISFTILNGFIFYLVIKLTLMAGSSKVKFESLKPNAWGFIKYITVEVLYMLAVFIGLLLFVFPGIFLAIKYSFASTVMIDKNTKIFEAFKESAKITQGKKMALLPIIIVLNFYLLLASIRTVIFLDIVDIIFSFLSVIAGVVLYKHLKSQKS